MKIVPNISDNSFLYHVDATHKVFPIDFSLREFNPKHDGNIGRVQEVAQHPFLKDILVDLIYPDRHQNVDYKTGEMYPLPVEAETFLRCFYALLEKDKYHSTEKKPKELVGTALGQEFSEELCKDIAKNIFSADSDGHYNDMAYCRRMLCYEDGFCHITMDHFWKNEINARVNQIEQLVKGVSPARQAEVLHAVLLTLDSACLDLIQSKQFEAAKSAHEPPTPDTLLRKLLSKRHKTPTKREHAAYLVENEKVGEKTLCSAFLELENHRNPKPLLLDQARHVYLTNLEKSIPPSSFETQCLELQRYIDVISRIPDSNELKQIFIDIMREQCGYEIDRIVGTYTNKAKLQPQNRYLDKLIYDAARSRAAQGVQCFKNALSLVEEFSNMVDNGKKLDGMYTMVHLFTDDGIECTIPAEIPPYTNRKQYFRNLQEFFVHYWTFAGHTCPVDDAGHFIDIECIANEFAHDAQEAAVFLGKDKTLVLSGEQTKELLQFCEDSITQADALMPAHKIASLSLPILIMAILQTLQYIVIEGVSSLLKDFLTLQQTQRQVQEQSKTR